MIFPQYRKRFDNKAFYKVTSFTTFEEIQLIGKRYFFLNVHAKKYFEQLQVRSMLNLEIELHQMSTKEEYEEQFARAKEYISRKDKG